MLLYLCEQGPDCIRAKTNHGELWVADHRRLPLPLDLPLPLCLACLLSLVPPLQQKSDEVDEWNLMFSDDPPSRLKAASSSVKTSAPDSHVLASRSVAASLRGPHPSPSVTPGMWATQDAAAVLSLLDIEQNLPSGDIRGNMRGRRGRHKRSKSDTNALVQSRWYGTELSVVEGRHPGGMGGVGCGQGMKHEWCSYALM